MGRAKDYIADEQWPRAIEELRLAVADAKEPRRDEALYWLAHSLNQSGDQASSVETIGRLERDFPASMWVKPARSLRIEIAVRLNRSDVLWWTALPPPAPPAPIKVKPPAAGRAPKVLPPRPLPIWYPDKYDPDADLRVQALGALMKIDAERAVPILGQIAFESEHPGPAARAVFMLAQSSLPEGARDRDAGRQGTDGAGDRPRGGGPRSRPLRWSGRVKGSSKPVHHRERAAEDPDREVAWRARRNARARPHRRIGEGWDAALQRDCGPRSGGGATQLARLYKSASPQGKRPIIIGLFSARADGELIGIAEAERDIELRGEALERLRLLGTPKAKEYLQKVSEKR